MINEAIPNLQSQKFVHNNKDATIQAMSHSDLTTDTWLIWCTFFFFVPSTAFNLSSGKTADHIWVIYFSYLGTQWNFFFLKAIANLFIFIF